MYATVSQSDRRTGAPADDACTAMAGVRARGLLNISSKCRNGKSVRENVHEAGALRIRFPRENGPGLNSVIVNTGGGMTGGDIFSIAASAGAGSMLTVTSAAAEKYYRSLGDCAEVHVSLRASERSSLAWLPQEAILFDGSRVIRRYDVDAAPDATLLLCDLNCIGRPAMGEKVCNLKLNDQWNIRIGGQLCFADYTCIDGNASEILSRPAITAGATSFGALIYAGPDAAAACQSIRTRIAATDAVQGGAGLLNGICVARLVAAELAALRACIASCAGLIYGAEMPRSWAT